MIKANTLDIAGEYAGAAAVFRDAVHVAEASGDPRLPVAINSLANADDELGRYSEAEQLYRRAMTAAAKDGVWNSTYALTLGNLGAHYVEVGRLDKAEALLRKSLAIYSALLPGDSIPLALVRNALANLMVGDRRYDEAGTLIEASLITFRKHPAPGSGEEAVGLNNLGVVRRYQGKNQEAIELFEQSIRITETELGPSHPALLRALNNLATMYAAAGRHDDADAAFQRAVSIAEKRLGSSHPVYARVLLNYAGYLRRSGRKAVAKTLAARANALLRDHARTNGNGMTIDVSAFRH
ncbi:MAG TPA: tetratricopeptide repeat protein [Bryobacteraceae bacterium]|jgi:tetratricopeptide (TPR) repeat protein|nr:tetratricopeptide repeat protein [Bryobacteraceae bacterium]